MSLVPHRFLLRVAHPCRHFKAMPVRDDVRLLDLSADCRIDNYAAIDAEKNILMVKGPVPGPNQGMVYVRESIRLNKSKTRKLAEAGK